MRVNVLSYEPAGGWILYDYAARLAEHLRPHVDEVALSFAQAPGFDVTFHVNYAPLRQLQVAGLHCTMVTHIDTPQKFQLVQAQAQAGIWGFCMSEETTRRLATLSGVPRFLNFAPPAMLPGARKSISVLVSGRLYDDGRKNEAWVLDFCRAFRPGDIVLRVMGAGWEARLAELQAQGYQVEHQPQFERDAYIEWLGRSNYMLYTGNDEGALSTLDALLYGVVPIVTAQGYHLEQEGEIITYANRNQLLTSAQGLQRKLDETNAQRARLTDWDGFARRHVQEWRALMAAQELSPIAAATAAASPT
jgi:hypothetical protein